MKRHVLLTVALLAGLGAPAYGISNIDTEIGVGTFLPPVPQRSFGKNPGNTNISTGVVNRVSTSQFSGVAMGNDAGINGGIQTGIHNTRMNANVGHTMQKSVFMRPK